MASEGVIAVSAGSIWPARAVAPSSASGSAARNRHRHLIRRHSLTDKSRVFVADHEAPAPATPVQGKIGFVGLGRMGTAMAANLAAAGRQVIAYVRHHDRMDKLASLGLKPTT